MSAFGMPVGAGIGPNQDTNNNTNPYTISSVVPGFQPQPMVQGTNAINWSPVPASAWSDPGRYVSGNDSNTSGGFFGPFQNPTYHAETNPYPWLNPIQNVFGSGGYGNVTGTSGSGNVYQLPGVQGDPNVTNSPYKIQTSPNQPVNVAGMQTSGPQSYSNQVVNYQGGYSNPAYQNQFGNNATDSLGNLTNPQTLQELYGSINSLNSQQLDSLSNRWGQVQQGFKEASGAYASAYANSNYQKQNPFTQQQTSDWLQASYNLLTNKLNQGGYL